MECPECGSGQIEKKDDSDTEVITVYECQECGYTRRKRFFQERNQEDDADSFSMKSKAVLGIIVISSLLITVIATLYY